MKNYRMPRKYSTVRKYGGKCEKCGKKTPFNEVYCYIDESNIAISYNAPYLCKECYQEIYGG